MTVEIIAIITPKAGKADRVSLTTSSLYHLIDGNPTNTSKVAELIAAHAEWVKANEPKTLKYECKREVNKKSGLEELIMVEA